jgi:hypothetical protein
MTSTPADLLEVMRNTTKAAIAVEVRRLGAVIEWCVIHATDDEAEASFGDHGIPLAGDGAPWVSQFAVMELGTALGGSTDSAKRYVGAVLEVRYRLPRVWERVVAGDLPFWKARFIAERTMCLPEQGALFVDQQVAFVAHKIGFAELQRQIDAAQLRFDPEAAEKARRQDADRRCFDIHKDAVSPAGTVPVSGTLDLPDALDLDAAVSQRAAELRDLGCEESLDVRRAKAVGDLARGQATFDYDKTRPVVLHLHGDTVFGNPNPEANVGRCDNTRTPVLAETIREWCGNPHAIIIVKPVKDLADHVHVAAYEVPDRLAEQDALVDLHCVFPWCTRPAARCDIDHAVPYGEGGPSCSCNTAPLCRGHHRLKTHGGWTYDVLDRGTYLWHTPNGHLFRRDHTGTQPIAAPRRRRI